MSQPGSVTSPPRWRLFVYGSLQRGEENYARYCAGHTAIAPAVVWGRLFRQTSGYPMLLVPLETRLTAGSGDPQSDLVRFAQLDASGACAPPSGAWQRDDWELIAGQVMEFDDPAARLAALDVLEEFVPGAPGRLYDRAIMPACVSSSEEPPQPDVEPWRLAWCYIAPDNQPPEGAVRIGSAWSGKE